MSSLLLGVVVLVLLLVASKYLTQVNARTLVPVVKAAGGIGALAAAGFLATRGLIGMALPLGLAGLSLLGWLPFGPAGLFQRSQKSPGQASRVRSAFIEMELDHDTGAMRGRILAGQYEGADLDMLDLATLTGFLPNIDEESRALLMAYLDRRESSWRDHVQGGSAAGSGSSSLSSGKMTEEEAYQILGLQPGANADEVGRAHRSLMKKLHPDQGGSTYLAARVNEAKDVLLRRHR
jgi:hypothetical protein